MTIKVSVDQAASLRRGINAPTSTAVLDIDPATLSQEDRDILSEYMRDGHDCTRLDVVSPTVEGLLETLARIRAEREQVVREAVNALDRLIASPQVIPDSRALDEGVIAQYDRTGTFLPCQHHNNLPPEHADRFATWKAEVEAANEQRRLDAIAAAQPEIDRRRQEREAREAAERAERERIKSERAQLITQLPEITQARIRDGYADDKEVDRLIRQHLRVIHDLSFISRTHSRPLRTLSDSQYQQLAQARERYSPLLSAVEIDPVEIATYRKATEHDDPEDIDDDGEVLVTGWTPVIQLRWTVADITVTAHIELT